MLVLALPVVLDHLSSMSMGFVDTIMVGKLGKEALGAVGIAASIYFFFMVFAYGTVSSVSPTVAHAFGAGDDREIEHATGQGFWLAVGLAALGIVVAWNAGPILSALGQSPSIIPLSESYVRALSLGMVANLCYANLRAFAVGLGHTRVTMVISFIAATLNIPLDYLLIFGGLGIPAQGVAGAGYATAIVQWSMFLITFIYMLRSRTFRRYHFVRQARRPDPKQIGQLLRLGVPIGGGHSMENGFFGLTNLLMGRIGTVALASHQVAINVAAFTFMVPLGISIALATRVGHAMGRREPHQAALAGWTGIVMGGLFMCITAALFILFSGTIVSIYTDDPQVLEYAGGLLVIAGAFQISDGLQVTAMGALRGLKDTARPMLTNLLAYWLVGLPVGLLLGFVLDYGGYGLWWGLTVGLSVAALLHALRFRKLVADRLGVSVVDRKDSGTLENAME